MVIVIYSDEGGTHSKHEVHKVAFYIRSKGMSYSTANEVVSLNVRGNPHKHGAHGVVFQFLACGNRKRETHGLLASTLGNLQGDLRRPDLTL